MSARRPDKADTGRDARHLPTGGPQSPGVFQSLANLNLSPTFLRRSSPTSQDAAIGLDQPPSSVSRGIQVQVAELPPSPRWLVQRLQAIWTRIRGWIAYQWSRFSFIRYEDGLYVWPADSELGGDLGHTNVSHHDRKESASTVEETVNVGRELDDGDVESVNHEEEVGSGGRVHDNGDIRNGYGRFLGRVGFYDWWRKLARQKTRQITNRQRSEDQHHDDLSILTGLPVLEDGRILDANHHHVGQVEQGNGSQLIGLRVSNNGNIKDRMGSVVARAGLTERGRVLAREAELSILTGLLIDRNGRVFDKQGQQIGQFMEGDLDKSWRYLIKGNGKILDDKGVLVGRVGLTDLGRQRVRQKAQQAAAKEELAKGSAKDGKTVEGEKLLASLEDLSILLGLHVKPLGRFFDRHGIHVGQLTSGADGAAMPTRKEEVTDAPTEEQKSDTIEGEVHQNSPDDLLIFEGLRFFPNRDDISSDRKYNLGQFFEAELPPIVRYNVSDKGVVLDPLLHVVGRVGLTDEGRKSAARRRLRKAQRIAERKRAGDRAADVSDATREEEAGSAETGEQHRTEESGQGVKESHDAGEGEQYEDEDFDQYTEDSDDEYGGWDTDSDASPSYNDESSSVVDKSTWRPPITTIVGRASAWPRWPRREPITQDDDTTEEDTAAKDEPVDTKETAKKNKTEPESPEPAKPPQEPAFIYYEQAKKAGIIREARLNRDEAKKLANARELAERKKSARLTDPKTIQTSLASTLETLKKHHIEEEAKSPVLGKSPFRHKNGSKRAIALHTVKQAQSKVDAMLQDLKRAFWYLLPPEPPVYALSAEQEAKLVSHPNWDVFSTVQPIIAPRDRNRPKDLQAECDKVLRDLKNDMTNLETQLCEINGRIILEKHDAQARKAAQLRRTDRVVRNTLGWLGKLQDLRLKVDELMKTLTYWKNELELGSNAYWKQDLEACEQHITQAREDLVILVENRNEIDWELSTTSENTDNVSGGSLVSERGGSSVDANALAARIEYRRKAFKEDKVEKRRQEEAMEKERLAS